MYKRQILSRRTKNNPILIGEPGTGKTAIVEGLAHRILRGDVPEYLKNKQVYSLDTVSYTHLDVYKRQAMVGAMMFLKGLWKKPGVWNVEEFNPDPRCV